MTSSVRIGNRGVGEGEPVFIIAEVGVNHNGDMRLATKLVDAASRAGVDAVKFQTFTAKNLTTRRAGLAEYQKAKVERTESQYDMIKSLELDYECFFDLKERCEKKGVLFLSTPHSPDAAEFLRELVPAYKIGSGDLTNLPFLEQVAKYNKPIILSTGMAYLHEVKEAVSSIRNQGNSEIVILHCVTNYPSSFQDINLNAMATMRQTFGTPVGFSDHTLGIAASIAAVALGACIIEKHFTLDKEFPGPDHQASLEPRELGDLVIAVRDVEMALGSGIKKPAASEEALKQVARKSIVTNVFIPKGTAITEMMIGIKRPGSGIAPKHWTEIVGRRAAVNIEEDVVLTWEMVE